MEATALEAVRSVWDAASVAMAALWPSSAASSTSCSVRVTVSMLCRATMGDDVAVASCALS